MRSAAAILALLLAIPLAAAEHHEHGSGPEPHVRVLASFEGHDGATYYVVDDHGAVQLWKESNGLTFGGQYDLAGEQSALQVETVCFVAEHDEVLYAYDEGACPEGVPVAPDTRVTNGYLVQQVLDQLP